MIPLIFWATKGPENCCRQSSSFPFPVHRRSISKERRKPHSNFLGQIKWFPLFLSSTSSLLENSFCPNWESGHGRNFGARRAPDPFLNLSPRYKSISCELSDPESTPKRRSALLPRNRAKNLQENGKKWHKGSRKSK